VEDDDSIALSAVEHFAFCPRQVYLIHAEGQFAANRFTVEGDLLHRRVTDGEDESRPGVRICRSLHLVSRRLGVRGIADVVEFRDGVPLPVEYKRGARTGRRCEQVQLALQAMCLEEMLGVLVPQGCIWHGKSRRRESIAIDQPLRDEAAGLVAQARTCLAAARAPTAVPGRHCDACSLRPLCLPNVTNGSSAAAWTRHHLGGACANTTTSST